MLTKKIIDISWPIKPEMTQYKDKKIISINHTKTYQKDNVLESIITLGSHTGTHIDAPAHFLESGKLSGSISLDTLIGPCQVLDLTHIKDSIKDKDLEKININKKDIILFKTLNSFYNNTENFNKNFIYIDSSGASYLAKQKIKTIGIDYLGLERNQPEHNTHKIFFNNNITVIEGLRLGKVNPGAYTLLCLPVALCDTDAAPARAVLILD
jgi:arylformamidase